MQPSSSSVRNALHIVGLNPAMDRTQFLDRFQAGEVNRAVRVEPMAGGKGIIVARALARLGTRAGVSGFLGGAVGEYIREECRLLDLIDRHTGMDGETRINSIIVDTSTGESTVINEPGPQVSAEDVDSLVGELLPWVEAEDIVALSGSFPGGVEPSFAGRFVTQIQDLGARVIVDASGAALEAAASATPWAVKCNLEEFATLRPDAPAEVENQGDRTALVAQMVKLADTGIGLVIVTLGAQGAIAVSKDEAVWCRPPRIDVVNATGSGDTFLAGFLHSQTRGLALMDAMQFAVAASVANALRPVPDLGPDPAADVADLVSRTTTEILTRAHR